MFVVIEMAVRDVPFKLLFQFPHIIDLLLDLLLVIFELFLQNKSIQFI